MSIASIQSALTKAYLDVFPVVATAFPNVSFSPPNNRERWVKIDFTPYQPFLFTLGVGGEDIQRGLFQLSFYYPQNIGTANYYADVETCRQQFVAGKTFTYNGQTVRVISCGARGSVSDGPWLLGIVSIEWEALLVRAIIT